MLPDSLSLRIDRTRLIMIVGVVLIHCNPLPYVMAGADAVTVFIKYFSTEWPAMCVPFFFFISAYLLQTKHPSLSFDAFVILIKKRSTTLLLSYILWNTIALAFWTLINATPLNQYTSGGYKFISVADLLIDVYWRPILVPLWFLRNLMGFIIIVPILQMILKKSPLLLLFAGYLAETYTPVGGALYYAAGLVAAQLWNPHRLEDRIGRLSFLAPLYCVITLCITVFAIDTGSTGPLYQSVKIMGFIGFMGLCSKPIPFGRRLGTPGAIFFVYAFHGIISPYIIKLSAGIYNRPGDGLLAVYILSFAVVITLSYVAYYCSLRFSPSLSSLLTGRRSDK